MNLVDPQDNLLWSEPVTGKTVPLWEANVPCVPVLDKGRCGLGWFDWRVLPGSGLMSDLRSGDVCVGRFRGPSRVWEGRGSRIGSDKGKWRVGMRRGGDVHGSVLFEELEIFDSCLQIVEFLLDNGRG